VASSLGSLPPRSPAAALRNPLKIAKPRKSGYIYTTAPQLRQVALAWFCPVPDLTDIRQERRCVLLAELLEERMRVRLREELGASYACSAHFRNHEGFPQLSYFALFAEVDPTHAQAATQAMRDELEQLRKKRFTDDEFERVKAPFLRSREEDLRSNGYWGHTVLRDAQLRPERIAAARDRATDTASITRTELEVLARRYLKPADAFQFVSYPRAEGSP
jgi:zinc protease